MSRAPALAVLLAVAACQPAGPRPEPPRRPDAALPGNEPAVRVGVLVDAEAVELGAGSPFTIRAGGEVLRAGGDERWRVTAEGGRLRMAGPTGDRVVDGPIVVESEAGTVRIGEGEYRGTALVRNAGDGRVTVVNVLEMERYLLGVVPREIGARPEEEIEAVKAQAIAARTYAISNLGGRASRGFDYYATVADQVYGGIAVEDPVASRAVRETRGEILTHDGRPILAFYHSTCGGRTANVEEVWRRDARPYLRSISDRMPGGGDRYYCDISNRFRWAESWSRSELLSLLASSLARHLDVASLPLDRVRGLQIDGRTTSGRVETLVVETDGGAYRVRGDSVRWILRPEPERILNSALIELHPEVRGGEVVGLDITGGGWGHGVGMCQMGAVGRARAGQSYRRILTSYYTDTEVERLY